MNASHPRLPRAALAGLLALALASCQKGQAETATATSGELPVRTVELAPVETGEVVEAVRLVGDLQGIEEVKVFALVPERIRTLLVKEGQPVRPGDALATLWSDLQSEGVHQAEAALEAALTQRDAAQDNLKRVKGMAEAGAAPQAQLEGALAQARAGEAQVRHATAMVATATAQRERTLVRSPIRGVVTAITLREGDLAGMGLPIMTIVRPDRLKAALRVPERDFFKVKEGMPVRIEPLGQEGAATEGKVTLKGPVIDRMTRTGLVEVVLENGEGKLVAGSAIRAAIELARRPNVVLAPAGAILLTADTERTRQAIAFVGEGSVARRRDVRLGLRDGERLEIVSGLAAGDALVVQGAHLLRDGNPIKVAAGAAAAAKAAGATPESGR
ncbi:MAG: efflux RND transporter periplasmic adaptor subunit [Deltaproteobacteria bacterium]|nr:efflux RND transporter periplasmic adaptor subunit [Deltaproteobacteria bacterium]